MSFLLPCIATAQLAPEQARNALKPGDGLAIDLVLSEPAITQPVFFNFDERGRLWVVQYRQYPWPAGLTLVGHDHYWRTVYDRPLPPPPYEEGSPFRGQDLITIHEDTNGDGQFDSMTVFAEGLNITTAVVRGRGGVWVLTPPQLILYPGADKTDRAEGTPVVHLDGFHIEDTHAVVNSLRWGPDGWLYAAMGSTVTADVIRPGLDETPIARMEGQHIWRYHPETRRFEVFAEGGGNAFGVEIDEKGRVFSGDNGGNNRGFHYVQHSYHHKSFGKHGALSNPYAFGHFPRGMQHHATTRFTHNFIIYQGAALPELYRGRLIGVDPMNHRLPVTQLAPRQSTFTTRDVAFAITTQDTWFRPQDIKQGPDGAVYVADWYDQQINHYQNHEGRMTKGHGRLYRIRAEGARAGSKPFHLAKKSSLELVELLQHENRWHREQARRLLGDRRDASLIPLLRKAVLDHGGQAALESLWALNLSGGFDETFALKILDHQDPYVRKWTVRLLGDDFKLGATAAAALVERALKETHPETRTQIASTAQRLPGNQALPVIHALLQHDDDAKDPYMPLLIWWALERQVESHREEVLKMFCEPALWARTLVREEIAWRIMRRYAAPASRASLLTCAALFRAAPDERSRRELMRGFEQAFEGRALPHIPDELAEAIAEIGGASVALRVRQGDPAAIEEGLRLLSHPEADVGERMVLAQVFGEMNLQHAAPVLKKLLKADHAGLARAALGALSRFGSDDIAAAILDAYPGMNNRAGEAALTALAGRPSWALPLMRAVDAGRISTDRVPVDAVELLRLLEGFEAAALVEKHFGASAVRPSDEYEEEVSRVARVLSQGRGIPARGRLHYEQRCAACHTLHNSGGHIGPDLTSYQRNDLDSLLLATVNPNAQIREGYENYMVTTRDGARYTGFLADQAADTIVIRSMAGQDTVLNRRDVEEMEALPRSLMPEGLLAELTEEELRDLFAYLQSTWATHRVDR